MNATPFVAVCLLATLALCIPSQKELEPEVQDKAQNKKPKSIAMQVWNIEDEIAKHRASKNKYTRFFRVPSTDCGIYTLKKGGKDGQEPKHGNDEMYYVVKGKAKIQCDGKELDVKTGSLVFIAAGTVHKFIDIEEEIELLVVFSTGDSQLEAAAKKNKK